MLFRCFQTIIDDSLRVLTNTIQESKKEKESIQGKNNVL